MVSTSGVILGNRIDMVMNEKFSKNEELANSLSHLLGAVLAVAGAVFMVRHSVNHGNGLAVISSSIFGASLITLYLSSTLTHLLPVGKAKDLFFNVDRIAIYLLIAGTYTPIALITLQGPLGWVIFGLEWGFALLGTLIILSRPGDYQTGVNTFYVVSYALMGWLILVAVGPLFRSLPLMGTVWILIGGISYTVGIPFFKVFKFPFHHLVWHLLVLGGSVAHFIAVFYYILPR